MTRPQTSDGTLAKATVLVTGSTLPVGVELVRACRAEGATVLVDRELDDVALSPTAVLGLAERSPLMLLVVGEGHRSAHWRARLSTAPAATIVTVHGPGKAPCDGIGTHVHHGPLNAVWTDCRGERHEGNDPGRQSAHDVADEVLAVVARKLTSSSAASRQVA